MMKLILKKALMFVRLLEIMVPFGSVMLILILPAVVLRLTLSVMFAPISISSETLKFVPVTGMRFVMFGARLSCMRKNPICELLMLSEVSFASMVKL